MRIVGGIWGGRRISTPAGRATRPTTDRVREAWMSAIGLELPGARVVDLFAGSGALGLEALSRGAAHVTFVENAPAALRVLESNLAALAPEQESFSLVRSDARRFAAARGPGEFDIALADPPYDRGLAQELADIFGRRQFARILCIEHSPKESIAGSNVVRQRRYGDTTLTFLSADDA